MPVATGDGLTDEMLGSGRIVTEELPVEVGDAVLVARTVTVGGLGTADGAKYWPLRVDHADHAHRRRRCRSRSR